jgi:hypothetical protein
MVAAFIPIVLALSVGVLFSALTWGIAFILLHHSMGRGEERQAAHEWTEEKVPGVPAHPEAWDALGDHQGQYADQWPEGPGHEPDGIPYPFHEQHMGRRHPRGESAGDRWGANT